VRAGGRLWATALLIASTAWLGVEGKSGLPREDAYRHNNLGVAHLERYDFRAAADAFGYRAEYNTRAIGGPLPPMVPFISRAIGR